jgi:hypothetical protein
MKQEATAYCKVCLIPHDEETHQATLAVRKWHRWQVIKGFDDTDEQTVAPSGEVLEVQEPRVA